MQNMIKAQITDWTYDHELNNDGEEKYIINLFGTTTDNLNINIKVTEFTPYFYFKIPLNWKINHVILFIDEIKKNINQDYRGDLLKYDIVKKHDFYGFTNNKLFKFVQLVFSSYTGFREYSSALRRSYKIFSISKYPISVKLYESNMDPTLRFMHIKKLGACGVIKISDYKDVRPDNAEKLNSTVYIETRWNNIHPDNTSNFVAKLKVASFDIECVSSDGGFPQPKRLEDKIIQIGTTFNYYGEPECYLKHIVTLGSCSSIDGVIVESYETEEELLIAWKNLILKENPDIITGYNIFGFDEYYIYKRSKILKIKDRVSKLSRIFNKSSEFIKKELNSAGMGDNWLKYYNMHGRVQIDLMKYIQNNFKFDSYKLDYVASQFIKEQVKPQTKIDQNTQTSIIYTGNIYGLTVGRYIKIIFNDGLSDNDYQNGKKFKVLDIGSDTIDTVKYSTIKIMGILDAEALEFKKYRISWSQAKDDVTPQDIFRLQKEGPDERRIIATYCIQDCILCNKLLEKLQVITNNTAMANVCNVPLSFIFLRGQGVKIFSLVAKKCREENYLIPVIQKPKGPDTKKMSKEELKKYKEEKALEGYEGATVLEPVKGVHFEPISVLDYASLYPRSMIYKNLSHEMLVTDSKYDNLPGYKYNDISYNNKDETVTIVRFAQKLDNSKGIIPRILDYLLDARKRTNDEMKKTNDEFKKKLLNGLQLAFKVVANSLYGQTGGPTSPIYMKEVAASTTATGRDMLLAAIKFCEQVYPKIIRPILDRNYDLYLERVNKLFDTCSLDNIVIFEDNKANEKMFIDEDKEKRYNNRDEFIKWYYDEINTVLVDRDLDNIKCIYGDTDSVFVNFGICNRITRERYTDHNTLDRSIKVGILCGDLINIIMPEPENLEYEKTFWPFVILSKKRYVGNLYGFDSKKFYQNSMGIVLKRRDNAPIVKIVVGGIVNEILNNRTARGAVDFTRQELKKLFSGKFPVDKFIISKTLKAEYADRTKLAHVVLADRMAERDPGNKPLPNDRIPYAYIEVDDDIFGRKKSEVKLQGDRVEHPDYIIEHNLKIDYVFYLTNQIQNPATQFLEYLIDKPDKFFDDYIIREMNKKKKQHPINFYNDKNIDDKSNIVIDLDDFNSSNQDIINSRVKINKKKITKTKKNVKNINKRVIDDNFNIDM